MSAKILVNLKLLIDKISQALIKLSTAYKKSNEQQQTGIKWT